MDFLQQGIEPEGFPLLLQSLKTDSPVKDIHSNPNKKLYGGKLKLLVGSGSRHVVQNRHVNAELTSSSSAHSSVRSSYGFLISLLFPDLMERSLGVNTFQLAKKLVDKVISVRYCMSTAHLHFQPSLECFYSEIRYPLCEEIWPMCWDYGLLSWATFTFCHLKYWLLNSGYLNAEMYYFGLHFHISNLILKSNEGWKSSLCLQSMEFNWRGCCNSLLSLPRPHSEEDSLVAMLRFQEFERSTVDTEGAMGLAAILAGQLPELRGKKWVRLVAIIEPDWALHGNSLNFLLKRPEVRNRQQLEFIAFNGWTSCN